MSNRLSSGQGQGLVSRNRDCTGNSTANGNVTGNQSSFNVSSSNSCTVQSNNAVQLILNVNNQQVYVSVSSIAVQLVDYVVEVSVAELVSLNDGAGGVANMLISINVQNLGISSDIMLSGTIEGYLGLLVVYALDSSLGTGDNCNVLDLLISVDGEVADYSTLGTTVNIGLLLGYGYFLSAGPYLVGNVAGSGNVSGIGDVAVVVVGAEGRVDRGVNQSNNIGSLGQTINLSGESCNGTSIVVNLAIITRGISSNKQGLELLAGDYLGIDISIAISASYQNYLSVVVNFLALSRCRRSSNILRGRSLSTVSIGYILISSYIQCSVIAVIPSSPASTSNGAVNHRHTGRRGASGVSA